MAIGTGGDEAVVAIGAAEGTQTGQRQQDALDEAAPVRAVHTRAAALGAELLTGLGLTSFGHR